MPDLLDRIRSEMSTRLPKPRPLDDDTVAVTRRYRHLAMSIARGLRRRRRRPHDRDLALEQPRR